MANYLIIEPVTVWRCSALLSEKKRKMCENWKWRQFEHVATGHHGVMPPLPSCLFKFKNTKKHDFSQSRIMSAVTNVILLQAEICWLHFSTLFIQFFFSFRQVFKKKTPDGMLC